MSFFFGNVKREPKKVSPSGPRQTVSAKTKQSAGALNRLGCKACSLANCGDRVEAYFAKRTDVFILGEAPTATDVKKGVPLVGKVGKLLNDVTPDNMERRISYGTIVQHRPPEDREPTFSEIESCRGHVTAAIEQAKPKLIIGLGPLAQRWVVGSLDMKGLRGRIMAVQIGNHKCWFMSTFNPEYVLKSAYESDRPLQSRMGFTFKMDFAKAFDYVGDSSPPHIVTSVEAKKDVHTYNGDPKAFLGFKELLDEFAAAKKAKVFATDVENYPLKPYSKDAVLLTASISYRNKKGHLHTFAFAIDHPKAQWTKKQREIILEEFNELISNKKVVKVAHNAPHEIEWFLHMFGTDFLHHDSWEDTMMQAHLIDERKGDGKEEDRRPTYQNLNFLTKQYFGLAIKSLFKLDKKDMRKTDIDECLLYNGVDSKYTLLLHEHQEQILKAEGLSEIFHFIKRRQTTVAIMQHMGMPVNQKTTKKFQRRLDKEVKAIEAKIANLKVVKKFIADRGTFNPHSGPDVLSLFKDYLKRTEIKVEAKNHDKTSDKKFRYAVDKAVLDKIDHPISKLIIRLRNRQKLKSTYVDEFVLGTGKIIYDDGMLHTTFNTTFTTSGRLSSEDPNMQNFPKRDDKWVRRQVTAGGKGYVLVSLDYGQLEWCLACVCSKDKVMVDATWTGYDVHMVWAEKIAAQWPKLVGGKKYVKDRKDEESIKKYKYARSLVKNKMVFPAIFGAAQESIGGYLNMPEDVTKRIFDEFWKTFHGLGTWQKKLMKGYYEKGYVVNLFGRKRRYPMTKNEAINFPIQSTAAEMVCDAMDRLSMLAVKTKQWHLHPRLNIHDDLTFIFPDNDNIIDEGIETAVNEMLKLPYKFVNVPMSVEVSIGTHWENQEEIGKFWTYDIGRHEKREAA